MSTSTRFGRHRISRTTVARRIFPPARSTRSSSHRTTLACPRGSGTARARPDPTAPLRRSREPARWRARAERHRSPGPSTRGGGGPMPGACGAKRGTRRPNDPTRSRTLRRHRLRQRLETPPDVAHVAERPAPPLQMLRRQPDGHEPGLADDLEELRAAAVDELGAELDRHRPSTRSARPDRPPILRRASRMSTRAPASQSSAAADRPAAPPPTIRKSDAFMEVFSQQRPTPSSWERPDTSWSRATPRAKGSFRRHVQEVEEKSRSRSGS